MCYKTDKKSFTLKKTTFEKKILKKTKSTLQRNVTAGIRACNHLHDARKIAPYTFELSKLAGFHCLKNVFNLRRQTYWLIDATDH